MMGEEKIFNSFSELLNELKDSREREFRVAHLEKQNAVVISKLDEIHTDIRRDAAELNRIKAIVVGADAGESNGLRGEIKQLRKDVDSLKSQQTKWMGAIAVIVFLISMLGSSIMKKLGL